MNSVHCTEYCIKFPMLHIVQSTVYNVQCTVSIIKVDSFGPNLRECGQEQPEEAVMTTGWEVIQH